MSSKIERVAGMSPSSSKGIREILENGFQMVMAVITYFSMTLLVGMTLVVGYAVITRYFFSFTPSWAEEIARLFMVWFSFLAIPLGVRSKVHVKVDILVEALSENKAKYLNYLVECLIIIFGILLLFKGTSLTIETMGSTLPALKIPSAIVYLCVPTSGFLVILAAVRNIFSKNAPREVED